MIGQVDLTGRTDANQNSTQSWPPKPSPNHTRGCFGSDWNGREPPVARSTAPAHTATADLYEADETAWLEAVADLIRHGRLGEVELGTLAEYLTDMAKRDRREVYSRLVVLLSHLLKWKYQPDHRSGSWRGTILEQQLELRQLLESGTLRNHANAKFADAYADARKRAAAETGLARATFPGECEWNLDGALAELDEDGEPDAAADRPPD